MWSWIWISFFLLPRSGIARRCQCEHERLFVSVGPVTGCLTVPSVSRASALKNPSFIMLIIITTSHKTPSNETIKWFIGGFLLRRGHSFYRTQTDTEIKSNLLKTWGARESTPVYCVSTGSYLCVSRRPTSLWKRRLWGSGPACFGGFLPGLIFIIYSIFKMYLLNIVTLISHMAKSILQTHHVCALYKGSLLCWRLVLWSTFIIHDSETKWNWLDLNKYGICTECTCKLSSKNPWFH